MSKLLEAIDAALTGRAKLDAFDQHLHTQSRYYEESPSALTYEWSIRFRWGVNISIRKGDDHGLDRAKLNATRQFRELIYGDIKVMVLELQRAIYDRDADKAEEITHKKIMKEVGYD